MTDAKALPKTVRLGAATYPLNDVLAAIDTNDIVAEAGRRGFFDDDDDDDDLGPGLREPDFRHFRSLLLRRAIPDALWELEKLLRDHDVLCAGFADDVAAYFRKA